MMIIFTFFTCRWKEELIFYPREDEEYDSLSLTSVFTRIFILHENISEAVW